MGKKGKFLVVFPVIMVIAFIVYLYLGSHKAEKIQIIEGLILEVEAHKSMQKPLYIGFIPQGNAVLMVRKWQPLADYLEKELGMPVEVVFRSSYQEIITALTNKEIDVCLTGALVYVLAREEADIRPLVRRKIAGTSFYYSLVVVRKDSGINTIQDLQDRSFAFTDRESTTGYLLPVAMMRQNGIGDPEHYFSEVIYTGNHDSALLAVLTRSVDGAAMSSTRWLPENPRVKELKMIWKSDLIFLGPFSVRGGLEEKLAERIKTAFLKIGSIPETQDLSDHIQVDGFEEASDSDYDSIRRVKTWVF